MRLAFVRPSVCPSVSFAIAIVTRVYYGLQRAVQISHYSSERLHAKRRVTMAMCCQEQQSFWCQFGRRRSGRSIGHDDT